MPTYTTDPVTGILIPTPEADPGPDYAQHISDALLSLAHLTHTGASHLDGYQIPAAGINFNGDISAQSNNLTSLRTTRYTSQSATLGGVGDVNCVYFVNGDAYVNNGSGTPVKLTNGGVINATTTNNYTSLTVSVNHTVNASDSEAVFNYKSYSGAKTFTLPLASTVQAGRFYYIKDQSGIAASNNITVQGSGSDTVDNSANYVIRVNFGAVLVMSDGVSNWQIYPFNRADTLYGTSITITSTSTDITNTSARDIINTASRNITNTVSNDFTITATHDFTVNATHDVSVYGKSEADLTCGDNGGGIATANVLLSASPATLGTINITTGGGVGADITINSSGDTHLYSQNKVITAGQVFMPMKAVTSSPYTVDTTSKDYIILVDTTSTAVTINLVAATTGRVLIIKDVAIAGTHNITLHRAGSENIEGRGADYVLDADYQGVTLANYGGDWFIVSTA